MHPTTIVYVLYGTVLCSVYVGSLSVAGSDTTSAVSGQPTGSNVNTTVAKVIDAMLADGQMSDGAIPIPEHHHDKAQRIVPRKGVDNEGVPSSAASARLSKSAVASTNVSSTSQSAAVVAADEKPNVASTDAPGGKPADTRNATSGGVPTKSTAMGSSSNATTLSNNITITSTSAISTIKAGSSTSALLQPQPQGEGKNGETVSNTHSSTTTTTTTTTVRAPSSSTTTTTSSSTTTTTTTKPPKKPKVTYSVEDEPKLLQAAKPGYSSPYDPVDSSGRLRVDEPLAQFSKEFIPSQLGGRDAPDSRREYVVPIVTLIFAIPLLLGLFLLSYRRAKEFWLTRHYRRMDFLIDGMYNY